MTDKEKIRSALEEARAYLDGLNRGIPKPNEYSDGFYDCYMRIAKSVGYIVPINIGKECLINKISRNDK